MASQQALDELSRGTKLDIEELREIRDEFAAHVREMQTWEVLLVLHTNLHAHMYRWMSTTS